MAARGKIFGAASSGDSLGVRDALAAGERVDSVDIGTSTALHWAARKGHLGVATVLVSEGATVLKKTKKGKTASDLAKENGHYNVMDFLTAAQDMQKGKSKTPKRERGNSKKGAAGSRGNTPLKASVLAGAAEDEGRARVIAWAKEQAASHLVEAEKERVEETKKAKADDENRNSSADKQARQQAEIANLLSVIKQARQSISPDKSFGGGGGGGGASDPYAASPASKEWQSAANVLDEIDSAASARAETTPQHSPARSTPKSSPLKSPSVRSPGGKDGGDHLNALQAKRDHDEKEKKKKKTDEAKAAKDRRLTLEKKLRAAEERRMSLAADKKAAAEADRVKRLADLEEKRQRALRRTKKKKEESTSSGQGPIAAVSLDTNLSAMNRSTSSRTNGTASTTPRTTPRRPSKTSSIPSRGPSRSSSRRTSKDQSTTATSSTTTTPTTGNKIQQQLKPAKRSGAHSSTSIISADLEDEYLTWVRGMSDSEKEKKDPSRLAKPTSLGEHKGSTRTVTIVRRPDSGLGVGIFSSKAGKYGVSVSSVLPQSPFSMAGVEVGDVFLDIDGTDVSNVSHGDAVRLLKAAPKRFVIKLYSRRKDRGTAPTQVRPPPPRFNGELEAKAREYTIARTSDKEPLGVALFSDSLDRWVQVHMAVPGGPFDRAGVGANDVILEVNGRSMLGLSHPEVVVELKRGPKDIKVKTASINDVLGTQLPEAPQNESDMMQSTTFVIRRIENKGLGIAICSDKGKTGIRIRNVTPDGPFGAAGVPRGSVIVRLDGAVMLDATHADVVEALRNAGDEFEVTVATDREVADYTARRADGEAAKISLSPYSSPTPLKPTKFEITRKPNQGLGVALCSNKRRLGVRISQLDPKGPLALAGVKELDVIVQVHGFPCLKASHDEVVQAFRRAPDDFTVVVVSGDHFDDVTPEYARSPTSAGSAQDALDEMRANILHSRTSRNRSTGSRGEIFVEQSSTGADEMRSDQHAFRDSRIADALENTEGFLALKKAQQQAMSLKASTQTYEDVFRRSESLGRPRSRSGSPGTGIPSPISGTGRTPVNLNKTIDEGILRVMREELAPSTPAGGFDYANVAGRTTARV